MVKRHTLKALPPPPPPTQPPFFTLSLLTQTVRRVMETINQIGWMDRCEWGRRRVERMLRVLIDPKKYVDRRKAARERPHALLQQKREGNFKMVREEGVERGRTSILVWQPAVVGDHYSAKVGRIGGRIVEIWAPQSVMKRERKSILVGIWCYLFQANNGGYSTQKNTFLL